MDKPTKVIITCETGEQEVIELTAEEIAELEAAAVKAQAELETAEEAEAAKQAAKASAESKLAALGLSPEEIAAIRG